MLKPQRAKFYTFENAADVKNIGLYRNKWLSCLKNLSGPIYEKMQRNSMLFKDKQIAVSKYINNCRG